MGKWFAICIVCKKPENIGNWENEKIMRKNGLQKPKSDGQHDDNICYYTRIDIQWNNV